jgi:hypothetical protein
MRTSEPAKGSAAHRSASILGSRARWGRVGYNGPAFAPAPSTYRGVNAGRARLTTVQDSGRPGPAKAPLANLYPLIAAALYELGFAHEAGPLATWRN